jgi:hypothetical protein
MNNISYDQFKWWCRKVKEDKVHEKEFVALPSIKKTLQEYPVIIQVGSIQVKVAPGADKDTVVSIVKALREGLCV